MGDEEGAHVLYGRVQDLVEDGSRESLGEALALCDELLSRDPNDADALHVKSLCMIHREMFDEALECMGEALPLERAYCLFRLGRLEEAFAVSKEVSTSPGRQLQAQILYKMQNYSEAAELYKKESESKNPENDQQALRCNLYAALISADHPSSIVDIEGEEGDYELLYNAGTSMLELGRWREAEHLLKRAEETCLASLGDQNCDQVEIAEELDVIRTQRAGALYWLARSAEAVKLLQNHQKSLPSTSRGAPAAVANLIVAQSLSRDLSSKEKGDLARRLKAALVDAEAEESPSLLPRELIRLKEDHCRALIGAGSLGEVESLLTELDGVLSHAEIKMLKAAAHFRAKRFDECEQILQEEMKKSESSKRTDTASLVWRLYLAQSKVLRGQPAEAVELLKAGESLPSCPALFAVRFHIKKAKGDAEAARGELLECLNYLMNDCDGSGGKGMTLSRRDRKAAILSVGHAFMDSGDYAKASEAFSYLMEEGDADTSDNDGDPVDRLTVIASQAIALSWFDPQAAEDLASQLSLEDLALDNASNLDAAALELTELPRTASQHHKVLVPDSDAKSKEAEKQKRLRRRTKNREKYLASGKAGDPSRPIPPPDPERWIPRSQRSYAKRSRKGKKGLLGAQGTGGGAAKDAAKLDAAANRASKLQAAAAAAAGETKGGK